MGKVKSIRFNERTERMFHVLKYYYSRYGSINDSEIIVKGIENQYDLVSDELNDLFRTRMKEMLVNNMFGHEAFEQLCNMLEILSVSRGSLLQDEFMCFLKVCVEHADIYEEEEFIGKQYEKIYETIIKTFDAESFDHALEELNEHFLELFGDRYKEKK